MSSRRDILVGLHNGIFHRKKPAPKGDGFFKADSVPKICRGFGTQ